MTPTDEQSAVVAAVSSGDHLKVKAYAGAGKTSTLKLAADARGRARGLYLAFNKDILDFRHSAPRIGGEKVVGNRKNA